MLLDIVDAHGLKGSISDMQRNLSDRSNLTNLREHLRREVQARRWRGNRATMSGIDRLIPFAICVRNTGRAFDVWRKWCRTDLRERVVERALAVEAHMSKFSAGFVEHFSDQLAFAEDRSRSFFQSRAGSDECFPDVGFDLAHEKDLDLPARSFTLSEQTGRNHTRVINDNDIIRTDIVRKLFKIGR